MISNAKTETVRQFLQLARQRQRIDSADAVETITYIAHVEHLLAELDDALALNRLQSARIQAFIQRHTRRGAVNVH